MPVFEPVAGSKEFKPVPATIGTVISDRERNGYHDSDFYAEYWDVASNYRAQAEAELKAQDKAKARNPKVFGREVLVVKGRKVPIGTQGRVFWIGQPQSFGYGSTVVKVGIECANGSRYFTASTNCEVVNPEQFEASAQVVTERAMAAGW